MARMYYINGRGFADATVHTDSECAASAGEGNANPLHEMHVDDETELCPECAGGSDTCDVVKGDGDICGRERPCPYHDS